MKADPDQHLDLEPQSSILAIFKWIVAFAVIGGLVFYWFQSNENEAKRDAAEIPTISAPATQTKVPETPDIPQRPDSATVEGRVAGQTDADQIESTPSLPLASIDGDSMLRQELTTTGADQIMSKLMSDEHPIDVSAAFIDGLGRGIILRKLLPTNPPKQSFSVIKEGEVIYMSPTSYGRYNVYTDVLTGLNTNQVLSSFHALRPMYEQAFEYLGLDPKDFDNSIIRALDQVLATPELTEPIALQPKSVVYTFADPALESLPAVQKQLLRMGPDNLARIKRQASAVRAGLLEQ